MSRPPEQDDSTNLSRRTFMQAAGTTAAGLFASAAAGTAAADVGPLDDRLLNWRVAEARKVWDRGYRGRPDRTLGLTDSGVAARHPDLGPWNGARLRPDGNGGVDVVGVEAVERTVPVTEPETFRTDGWSGQAAGTAVERAVAEETEPFEIGSVDGENVLGYRLEATLTWNVDVPEGQPASIHAVLQRDGEDGWEPVRTMGETYVDTVESDNVLETSVEVTPGESYRFAVRPSRGAASWELTVEQQKLVDTGETETRSTLETEAFDGTVLPAPGEVDAATPKTVGWYNEQTDWGDFDVPRDRNGHGTHCSGIMTATGRASTVDPERTEVHEENTVLLPGDFLEYEVTAAAGTSVFASALGTGIVVEIVHDGEVLDATPLRFDSSITDEPTVHDAGEATYTVRVRPTETESAVPVAEQAQAGNPLAGRLEEIAVGAYRHPATTEGDRLENDDTAVHTGVAPNFSLAGFQGLSQPAQDLGDVAADVSRTLNMRAVNMSWGALLGAPLSAFGLLPSTAPALRDMADEGILTVAAAGNSWTPANGNAEPAAVGEAISVVATDPFDGITGYSSGGLGQFNEDVDGFDAKPDVTAPGGDIKPDALAVILLGLPGQLAPADVPSVGTPTPDNVELVRATLNPDPEAELTGIGEATVADTDVPQDHRSIGGTSMASPYVCGVSGLVAQAMEEDAPDAIALPEPADSGFEDTMRLKQVVLATASTTAFTAAPYHNAQLAPSPATYTHGERDPYEGYGRVNPDAAVDAVTRDLLAGESVALGGDRATASTEETVGLDVPFDSRAVAGYVQVPGGDLEASVEFTGYSGGNAGTAAGDPQIDLFVYDAENPADAGDPNIVDSDVGTGGTAAVSTSVDRGSREEPAERTFLVVAKLVDVPGAVNGFDVQANFEFDVDFDPAEAFGPAQVDLEPTGSRSGDGSVFTAGQTNRVEVTVEDFNGELTDAVTVTDRVPDGWTVDEAFGDVERFDAEAGVVVFEPTVTADDLGDGSVTLTYFAEAPEEFADTDTYTIGPATAEAVEVNDLGDGREAGSTEGEFGGTATVVVAGVSTNT